MSYKKIKIATIVGTRPELIRLSRVISKLDKYCEHIFVHTGQNYDYELNEIFFDDLDIRKPDIFLESAQDSPASSIGNIISLSDKAMTKHNPDAVLILGDTNSSLAAIAAKRKKIPIFHMEAGNRCFDFRVPEEINRRIVDHISDINLPYSSIAKSYLLREGLPPDQVIKTGSPMKEVLDFYSDKINSSKILDQLELKPYEFFLISSHREENVDSEKNLLHIIEILNALVEKYDYPIIFSTHPRTQKRLDGLGLKLDKKIQFHKPFGFSDYIKLQTESKCVLSDSGTITEESSILNFPAINIREVHERPEGNEEASVIMSGLDSELVIQSLELLENQARGKKRILNMVDDYMVDNVSEKVLRIILSYTGYINRKVWNK